MVDQDNILRGRSVCNAESAAQTHVFAEVVAATPGFRLQSAEKRRDAFERLELRLKTHKLRVMAIPFSRMARFM